MNYRQDDKQADREMLLSKVVEKFGKVNFLVNNAAIICIGRFFEITPAVFLGVMDCNVNAPLYLAQEFAKI